MSKIGWLWNKYNKMERKYIREMAKVTHLKEENRRIKDGSLVDYLRKECARINNEKIELSIKVTLLELELKKFKEESE